MTVENLKSMLSPDSQRHYIDESTVQAYEAPPDIQMAAHVLVSERHGKFDLIHLVTYLMGHAASAERDAGRWNELRLGANVPASKNCPAHELVLCRVDPIESTLISGVGDCDEAMDEAIQHDAAITKGKT